eukprot:2056922-Karenia_brevis.AAC.1
MNVLDGMIDWDSIVLGQEVCACWRRVGSDHPASCLHIGVRPLYFTQRNHFPPNALRCMR